MKRTTLIVALAMITALSGCASNDGPRLDDVEVITKAYNPKKSPALNLLEMTGVDKGYRDIKLKDADLAKIRKEGGAAKFEWGTAFTASNAVVSFLSGGWMGLATGAFFLDWSDDYDYRTAGGAGVSFISLPSDGKPLTDAINQQAARDQAQALLLSELTKVVGPLKQLPNDRHGRTVISFTKDSAYCAYGEKIVGKPRDNCRAEIKFDVIGIASDNIPAMGIAKGDVIVAGFFYYFGASFLAARTEHADIATLIQRRQVGNGFIEGVELPFVTHMGKVYPFISPIDGAPVFIEPSVINMYYKSSKRRDASGKPLVVIEPLAP